MEYQNFFRLRQFSFVFDYFCIIDVADHLAGDIFSGHRIPIGYDREFADENGVYRLRVCRIRKRDRQRFLNAMERLKDKMLICGYANYPDFCADIQRAAAEVEQGRKIYGLRNR